MNEHYFQAILLLSHSHCLFPIINEKPTILRFQSANESARDSISFIITYKLSFDIRAGGARLCGRVWRGEDNDNGKM